MISCDDKSEQVIQNIAQRDTHLMVTNVPSKHHLGEHFVAFLMTAKSIRVLQQKAPKEGKQGS
jgi:hypothetical protein